MPTPTTESLQALYQKLWEVQKKVPVVPLYGKAFWLPPEFLLQHAHQPTKKLSPPEEQIPQFRRDYVAKMDKHLAARVRGFYVQACAWMKTKGITLQCFSSGILINVGDLEGGIMTGRESNVRVFQNVVHGVWRFAFTISNAYRVGENHSFWELDNNTIFNNVLVVFSMALISSMYEI